MSEPVLLDEDNGVVTLTLNRPDNLNALTEELQESLMAQLHDLRNPENTPRCLVIESEGDAFSAGGDIEAMKEGLEADVSPDLPVRHIEEMTNRLMGEVVRFPAPTVAKLDGMAVGAGANLAIACDMQLANENAAIGFLFRKVGLSIDAGTSYLLPRLVGLNVAKELIYTGEIVGATRAKDLGLFNRVFEPDVFEDECESLIRTVADGPTVALRHSKRLLEGGLQKSFEEAITDESANQGMIFQTDDHREGVEAFAEGREPDFNGS